MVKHPAWAAAINSSGLVPFSFSKRVLKEYGVSASTPESVERLHYPHDWCHAKPLLPCGSCNVSLALLDKNRMYFPHGCFSIAASTGIFRNRFPVAAKIALATAGTIAEVPHSPIPPGGSELSTM
jgi:hypothetical protein